MANSLIESRIYIEQNKKRKRMRIAVIALGALLAVTILSLFIFPGFADETEYICNEVGHVHTDDCYLILSCTFIEHEHSEECYDEPVLSCAIPPNHTHDETCDTMTMMICRQEEDHIHDIECYDEAPLICVITEEDDEYHIHDEYCYDEAPLICLIDLDHEHTEDCETTVIICEIEEDHIHDENCYFEPELICTQFIHTHDEYCYTETSEPQCGLDEHEHTDECLFTNDLGFVCPLCLDDTPHGHSSARTLAAPPSGFMGISPMVASDAWDLANFVKNITVRDAAGNLVTSGNFFYGQTYRFNISFAEFAGPGGQFAYNAPLSGTWPSLTGGSLVYLLPPQLVVPSALSGDIKLSNGSTVGKYSIATSGRVDVRFGNYNNTGVSISQNFIDYYTDVNFSLEISAQFQSTTTAVKIIFGANAEITVTSLSDPPANLQVTKSATAFNAATETVNFTITIKAVGGPVTDVTLTDVLSITGSPLGTNGAINGTRFPTPSAIFTTPQYRVNSGSLQSGTITWDSVNNRWQFNFVGTMNLNKDDVITVTYVLNLTPILDYMASSNIPSGSRISRYDFNLSLNNTATARGKDGTKDVSANATTTTPMQKSFLTKSGTYRSTLNQIEWTINIGDGNTMLNGALIDDLWPTTPAGQTLTGSPTITFYNASNSQIGTASAFTSTSATGFTYNIPSTPPNIYRVVIVYSTARTGGGTFPNGTYNNRVDVTINGNTTTKIASVGVSTPGNPGTGTYPDISTITGTKESEWVFDSVTGEPTGIRYTAKVTIPAGYKDVPLIISDTLWITDTESLNTTNIDPYGGAWSATLSRGYAVRQSNRTNVSVTIDPPNPTSSPTYYFSVLNYSATGGYIFNQFGAIMGPGTYPSLPQPNSGLLPKWPHDDQRTVTLTYTIPLSSTVYYLNPAGNSTPASWEHNNKSLKTMLEMGWYVTNRVEIWTANSTTFGGEHALAVVTDYLPIRKFSSPNAADPTVFDYQVRLNWRPSWNGNAWNSSVVKRGNGGYSLFDIPGMPAIFEDTFDEHLEYVPGSFRVERVSTNLVLANYSAPTPMVYYGPYSIDIPTRVDLVNVDGNRIWVDFSKDFIQYSIPDTTTSWGARDPMTVPAVLPPANWYTGNYRFIVYYQLRLKDEYSGYMDDLTPLTMENTATIYPTSDKFKGRWSSSRTVSYTPPKPVDKKMNNNTSADVVSVEIIINPLGERLRPLDVDEPRFTAVDTMNDNLTAYLETIKIYTKNSSGSWVLMSQETPGDPTSLWSINPIDYNTLEIQLIDEIPIRIVYEAMVHTFTDGTSLVRNDIEVYGYSDFFNVDNYLIVNAYASAGAFRTSVRLYKEDVDTGARLTGPGFGFDLYMRIPGDGPHTAGATPSITYAGMTFYYVTTADVEDEYYEFDDAWLTYYHNAIFLIVETDAPANYMQPTVPNDPDFYTFFALRGGVGSYSGSPLRTAVDAFNGHVDAIGDGKTVRFTSDYIRITNKSVLGEVTIEGTKTVSIPTAANVASLTGTYIFVLSQVDEFGVRVPDSSSVLPAPYYELYAYVSPEFTAGKFEYVEDIVFDTIYGLVDGTYYFKIEEDLSTAVGWFSDTGAKFVRVTVTGGVASVQVVGEAPGTIPVFANKWLHPDELTTDVTINGKKTITVVGTPAETGPFVFRLVRVMNESNIPAYTIGSDAYEEIETLFAADTFSFTMSRLKEGVYYYLLEEVSGSSMGWSYDSKQYLIKVSVTERNPTTLDVAIQYQMRSSSGAAWSGSYTTVISSFEYTFHNTFGAATPRLPEVGGKGLWTALMTGLAIMAIAGIALTIRNSEFRKFPSCGGVARSAGVVNKSGIRNRRNRN